MSAHQTPPKRGLSLSVSNFFSKKNADFLSIGVLEVKSGGIADIFDQEVVLCRTNGCLLPLIFSLSVVTTDRALHRDS